MVKRVTVGEHSRRCAQQRENLFYTKYEPQTTYQTEAEQERAQRDKLKFLAENSGYFCHNY
jgi:hypothetical protein